MSAQSQPCTDADRGAGSEAVRSGLVDLLARVEGASAPDREIDGLLDCLSDPLIAQCWPHWTREQREGLTPHYTASIDAALGLVERVLPGWAPALRQDARPAFGTLWHAMMVSRENPRTQHATWGFTAPLAILAALLKAKLAEGEAR